MSVVAYQSRGREPSTLQKTTMAEMDCMKRDKRQFKGRGKTVGMKLLMGCNGGHRQDNRPGSCRREPQQGDQLGAAFYLDVKVSLLQLRLHTLDTSVEFRTLTTHLLMQRLQTHSLYTVCVWVGVCVYV